MTIVLYDLAGRDGRRFSPYCWRTKLSLAHKGLAFETVPTPFTDIARINGGGFATVPVIRDGDRWISDSFAIAEYLETTYPDRPSLFGGEGGRAVCRFVEAWAASLHGTISRVALLDIHDRLTEADRPYFRQSREARLKDTLENICADRTSRVTELRQQLLPVRLMLKAQPFLAGDAPAFADYILFGTLQWPRVVCEAGLVPAEDPVRGWFDRMLDLHDGLARSAVAAAP